jgi:hypothetical protein
VVFRFCQQFFAENAANLRPAQAGGLNRSEASPQVAANRQDSEKTRLTVGAFLV